MEKSEPAFQKYIFVCENQREEGKCCAPEGMAIRQRLKELVAQKGLKGRIRVSRTGCQDACAQGPNVLVMPDHVWFKGVRAQDAEKILAFAAGENNHGS